MTFLEAALVYLRRGYLAHPLENDANGFPKKPIVPGWTGLERTEAVIKSLPWDRAKGLGIVLGAASSGLACLDIDDTELPWDLLVALNYEARYLPRTVRTIRQRGHIYVQELDGPSPSTRFPIRWRDREITIELKATGTQVAAPPTPGYTLLTTKTSQGPMRAFTVASAWEFLLDCFEDRFPGQITVPTGTLTSGYPQPWAPAVHEEQRNNTAYIEAHRLREAGMPLEEALRVMEARFGAAYDKQGIAWPEIARTVRSAYQKGEVRPIGEAHAGETSLLD